MTRRARNLAGRLRDRLRCRGHHHIKHLGEPVDRPIDLALADDQGRREADGVAMSVLGQHADIDQPPHHRARVRARRIELNTGEQADAANLANDRIVDPAQALQEMRAGLRGTLAQAILDQRVERGQAYGSRDRVAAKGAAVIAGLEHAHHLAPRQEHLDGEQVNYAALPGGVTAAQHDVEAGMSDGSTLSIVGIDVHHTATALA
jgi:hypothetical protein